MPPLGQGMYCSIRHIAEGEISICSLAHPPTAKIPVTLWTDAIDFGGTWMWDNLVIEGDKDWIVESIREGDCMAVSD